MFVNAILSCINNINHILTVIDFSDPGSICVFTLNFFLLCVFYFIFPPYFVHFISFVFDSYLGISSHQYFSDTIDLKLNLFVSNFSVKEHFS